jgi:hypothetical protein
MEDKYSTTIKSAHGNLLSDVVPDSDKLDDIATNATPTVTTSAYITSMEHTLACGQATGMLGGNVQTWQHLFLVTLVSLLSLCEWSRG